MAFVLGEIKRSDKGTFMEPEDNRFCCLVRRTVLRTWNRLIEKGCTSHRQ
jgi:hypothetical protein